jgi:hypothetical protein
LTAAAHDGAGDDASKKDQRKRGYTVEQKYAVVQFHRLNNKMSYRELANHFSRYG